MNIIETLTSRIEKRLAETATPCKTYKTKGAAEKATAEIAQIAANHFATGNNGQPSAQYVVIYIEKISKWVGAVDLNELVARKTSTGGYLGICGQKGFYTY